MTHSGGKPHTNVGDRGQRYELRFYERDSDETAESKVFGWASTEEGANKMLEGLKVWPHARDPFVVDRNYTSNVHQGPAPKLTKETLDQWLAIVRAGKLRQMIEDVKAGTHQIFCNPEELANLVKELVPSEFHERIHFSKICPEGNIYALDNKYLDGRFDEFMEIPKP